MITLYYVDADGVTRSLQAYVTTDRSKLADEHGFAALIDREDGTIYRAPWVDSPFARPVFDGAQTYASAEEAEENA